MSFPVKRFDMRLYHHIVKVVSVHNYELFHGYHECFSPSTICPLKVSSPQSNNCFISCLLNLYVGGKMRQKMHLGGWLNNMRGCSALFCHFYKHPDDEIMNFHLGKDPID